MKDQNVYHRNIFNGFGFHVQRTAKKKTKMKIPNKISTLTITALFAIGLTTACQNQPTSSNNTANQTANKANINAVQNANTEKKPETNSAANDAKSETNSTASVSANSPEAAYKSYYAARKNKDIKALKQLVSKEMVDFFKMMGGEDNQNALDEGLKGLAESPQGASDEIRDLKVKGNTAIAKFQDKNGEWKTMDFVKEAGTWKLTIPKLN